MIVVVDGVVVVSTVVVSIVLALVVEGEVVEGDVVETDSSDITDGVVEAVEVAEADDRVELVVLDDTVDIVDPEVVELAVTAEPVVVVNVESVVETDNSVNDPTGVVDVLVKDE
jgi:hypothetical protein